MLLQRAINALRSLQAFPFLNTHLGCFNHETRLTVRSKGIRMGEDITLKSVADKFNLQPVARWKPVGFEVDGFDAGQQATAGYTSEGSVGLEIGSEHIKVGVDFYGRASYNGNNVFSMGGGQRISTSIDQYYCAILGGARTNTLHRLNEESLNHPAQFSIEGGFEMGRRSENMIPGFAAGLLWNAEDDNLASTYVMLGYDW